VIAVALPRKALLLQVLAVLSSLLPHLSYLPIWLYLMVAFVLGWRWLVYTGHLSFPGRFAKLITVILACVGVYTLSGGQISLEGSSAFLISAGVLKLLELATRRDGIVVVFIALQYSSLRDGLSPSKVTLNATSEDWLSSEISPGCSRSDRPVKAESD